MGKSHYGKPVIWPHTLWRPPPGIVRECKVVLDVGAGIRPMRLYKPERHICVEPHGTYCDILRAAGYEVWQETAEEALSRKPEGIGAVFLLDVVEHMEKEMGQRVIELAKEVAEEQVVLFTPVGFLPQNEDKWGLDGLDWQIHRSGWLPEEFPGWYIKLRPPGCQKGFIAIWDCKTAPSIRS